MASATISREGERAILGGLFLLVRSAWWLCVTLPVIVMLVIIRRKSLALALWGKGSLMTWIAERNDADSGMYDRPRWKATRRTVYFRNKRTIDGVDYFTCEVTGRMSTTLKGFHVDHKLPRSTWPYLAYDVDNLRLVLGHVNIKKSDKTQWWFVVKFSLLKRC